MSHDVTLLFAAVVVSWVIFIFNFVLGFYMGRSVEAAERTIQAQKEKEKKVPKIEDMKNEITYYKLL